MGYEAADLLRHLDLPAGLANVVRVLCGQIFVVLWLQEVQEFCGLCTNHHLGRVRLPRAHSVDDLVLRAEWHLGVSVRGAIRVRLGQV